jgi:hypothetical protein
MRVHSIYKDDEFGADRPSPIPVIDGVAPPEQPQEFEGTPVVLNSRNSVRELQAELAKRTDRVAKPLEKVWDSQAEMIGTGSIIRGGLSGETMEEIEESYQDYVDNELSATWLTLAAIGGANIERGIMRKWPQAPGTIVEPSLPGPAADEWIRTRAFNLVVEITDSQRIAAQNIVQRGLAEGLNEREVARRLQEVVGLTNREAQAVENFRSKLIADGVNPRIVERRVATKARRLHRVRARRIARTEMTWAYNMGQLDAVKSYQASGWIPKNVVVAKKWRKVLPVQECFCESLDGKIVDIDSTFPGLTPEVPFTLTPPAHPNCACVIDVVVFEAGALGIPGIAA